VIIDAAAGAAWEIWLFAPGGTWLEVRECGVYDPHERREAEHMAARLRDWLALRVCSENLFDRCGWDAPASDRAAERDDRMALLGLPDALHALGLDPARVRVAVVPYGSVDRDGWDGGADAPFVREGR